MTLSDWVSLSAIAGGFTALFTLLWTMRRAHGTDLKNLVASIVADHVTAALQRGVSDNDAIVAQVRALELEVAKNYITRSEIKAELDLVVTRLEAGMTDLSRKVEDLNRYLRQRDHDR